MMYKVYLILALSMWLFIAGGNYPSAQTITQTNSQISIDSLRLKSLETLIKIEEKCQKYELKPTNK